uniref:Ig-like domain-containing protein n=1 Tax=Romanomermis culicivorax TaxID=13658 RepID=A0A915L2Q2_ROMCU
MVAMGALFLQAVVLTTSSVMVTETTRAPPIVPENVRKRLVAREGLKTFTVVCPAEGASPLYVSWTKDGEPITSAWDRFKQVNRERDLRIKNVMLEDAGLYKCHVANGFGSANMEFTLQVIGESLKNPPWPDPGTRPGFKYEATLTVDISVTLLKSAPNCGKNWVKNSNLREARGSTKVNFSQ